jgi:hypothetical protein
MLPLHHGAILYLYRIQSSNKRGKNSRNSEIKLYDMNWYKKANSTVSYTGILLDQASHQMLIERMSTFIPKGWKIYAHHMTINMGPAKNKKDVGKIINLTASEWAKDEKVIAVGVQGYDIKDGRKPHVTVAVNTEVGGKPKDSNLLSGWQPISQPIPLAGVVQEVPTQQ